MKWEMAQAPSRFCRSGCAANCLSGEMVGAGEGSGMDRWWSGGGGHCLFLLHLDTAHVKLQSLISSGMKAVYNCMLS